jgi:hypothetical protein
VFAVLAERAGEPWPDTYTVRTPSGGTHLYFYCHCHACHPLGLVGSFDRTTGELTWLDQRSPRNSASHVGPMIDVRAHGGYVLGAGSSVDGRQYESYGGEVAPLPTWLAAALAPPAPRAAPTVPPRPAATLRSTTAYVRAAFEAEVAAVAGAWEGSRNAQLNKSAFALARFVATGDLERDVAVAALSAAAEHAGLGPVETTRTLRSAFTARGAA